MTEIARRANTTPGMVHIWRTRYPTFPAPLQELSIGPVWRWEDVVPWLSRQRRKGSIRVMSLRTAAAESGIPESELRDAIEAETIRGATAGIGAITDSELDRYITEVRER